MLVIVLSDVYLIEKLLKYVVKKSIGISVNDIELKEIVGATRLTIMRRVIGIVSSQIVEYRNNSLRCGLCGKGPFTRRGIYLHLTRVHREEIIHMINRKYRELLIEK